MRIAFLAAATLPFPLITWPIGRSDDLALLCGVKQNGARGLAEMVAEARKNPR